jgi:potassium channel
MIGLKEQHERGKGWIVYLVGQNMQQEDFTSLYITAVYFIITTFSSVGYGDVYGNTATEWVFQILVEMLGIIVFGYMIGTF